MRRFLLIPLFLLAVMTVFAQDFPGQGSKPPDKRGQNEPTEFPVQPFKRNKLSAEANMKKADNLFARKRYNRASKFYQQVTFERNSPYVSDAQFQLAECYFRLKRYDEARTEYEVVTRQFPDQPRLDKAYYQIGVCWYEASLPAQYTQEETHMAVTAFEDYLERFPARNPDDVTKANEYIHKCEYKLLQKSYFNGYTYYRMYDFSAALLYFNEVRQVGITDHIDKLSLYYSAKIYLKRKDAANARSVIDQLIQKYPTSKEARRLKKHAPRG
jgi:outer membrane protein assembly factor BamD